MSSDGDDRYDSNNEAESELDDKKHNKLIENVLNLSKKHKLKKASRTEPTLQVSEFNLVKSSTGKKGNVQLKDLTKSLKKISKHINLGQQVEAVEKKSKTLSKPLEKPQAERIRRTIAYEATKKQLNRWDAVVTSNRAASTLRFPLNDDELNIDFNAKPEDCFKWGKTKLQLALEKVITPTEVEIIEVNTDENEFPLTMEEMMEKRKETAKLRAVQSYKEAKARRLKKIKSKKFHRIDRRAKAKQQLKEFEDLQKINPEAALEKLEELEKARAQERASLRHKSSGQWAKNKQIRAKYDKESRQVLAEQLAISRDLTQKLKKTESDSESDEDALRQDTISINVNKDNPWASNVNIKPTQEVADFITNLKTFTDNQNHLEKQNKVTSNLNNEESIILPSSYDIVQKPLTENIALENESPEGLAPSGKKYASTESLEEGNQRKKNKRKKSKCRLEDDKLTENVSTNGNQMKLSPIDANKDKSRKLKSAMKPSQTKLDKFNPVAKITEKKGRNVDAIIELNTESETSRTKIAKTRGSNVHLEYGLRTTWIVSALSENSIPSRYGVDEIFDTELNVLRNVQLKLTNARNTANNMVSQLHLPQKRNISKEGAPGNDGVDDVFAGLEKKLRVKVQEKINILRKNKDNPISRNVAKNTEPKLKKSKSNFQMLELQKERRHTRSNGGLHEGDDADDEEHLTNLKRLEDILAKAQSVKKSEEIDPNKFINMRPIKLNTKLPDMLVNEGDDDGSDEEDLLRNNQKDVISEAFCDDDIIEDFHRDKQKEMDKNTPKDVDLTMPGWGSWGGKNLKVPKWKRRRFILKAPKPEDRKDSNRGNLIINEDANNAKVAKHLVSDVPFPYKDVKEFEISLKTPIDGTFIPQTAFRKFIEPPVITKIGAIIEPMTEDILLKKKKKTLSR